MIGIASFTLVMDPEEMRSERYIIGLLICVWCAITPCCYVQLLKLFCTRLCRKRLRCVGSTDTVDQIDLDNILEVEPEYFNQKYDRDDYYTPELYSQHKTKRDSYRTSV